MLTSVNHKDPSVKIYETERLHSDRPFYNSILGIEVFVCVAAGDL